MSGLACFGLLWGWGVVRRYYEGMSPVSREQKTELDIRVVC